jgi:hypothetical protein
MSLGSGSTGSRRLLFLVGFAAIVGGVAGGAAYLLVSTVSLITHIALLGEWGWGEIPPLSDLEGVTASAHRSRYWCLDCRQYRNGRSDHLRSWHSGSQGGSAPTPEPNSSPSSYRQTVSVSDYYRHWWPFRCRGPNHRHGRSHWLNSWSGAPSHCIGTQDSAGVRCWRGYDCDIWFSARCHPFRSRVAPV